ncbi:unnamed protein product [Fusarium equiseti]|uniref:Uncharacterized protein n=1 Tax=Fusarium equiseti TaxID=61235 RepID=A0A8J2ICH3_FUSEQ|nr:unnamed protein product [Fusarium equiseti]
MYSGDMNVWGDRSPTPGRTDAKQTKIDEEQILKMEDDLTASEKIIAEAQREAAVILAHCNSIGHSTSITTIQFAKLA